MMDLDLGIISESEKRLKKKLILDYIYSNLKHHNFWAYRYFFCEFLALINVVGKYVQNKNILSRNQNKHISFCSISSKPISATPVSAHTDRQTKKVSNVGFTYRSERSFPLYFVLIWYNLVQL